MIHKEGITAISFLLNAMFVFLNVVFYSVLMKWDRSTCNMIHYSYAALDDKNLIEKWYKMFQKWYKNATKNHYTSICSKASSKFVVKVS